MSRNSADLRTDTSAHTTHTLGSAGTETVFDVPDYATGFKLWPRAADAFFALGESPSHATATSGGTLAETSLGVGGIAKADQWEVRNLPHALSRALHVKSAGAATVVDLEFFAQ